LHWSPQRLIRHCRKEREQQQTKKTKTEQIPPRGWQHLVKLQPRLLLVALQLLRWQAVLRRQTTTMQQQQPRPLVVVVAVAALPVPPVAHVVARTRDHQSVASNDRKDWNNKAAHEKQAIQKHKSVSRNTQIQNNSREQEQV
jgi:hypothetical protein